MIRAKTTVEMDIPTLHRALEKSALIGLRRLGAFARTVARRSMRKRKKASKPGAPPRVITGKLKKGIFFAIDKRNLSVAVGPMKIKRVGGKSIASGGRVPRVLEEGGRGSKRKNPRRMQRRVGGGGEVRITKANDDQGKMAIDYKGKRKYVIYGKLRNQEQVQRAEKIQTEIYGPKIFRKGLIKSRPYMKPADKVTRQKLIPGVFAGTFK